MGDEVYYRGCYACGDERTFALIGKLAFCRSCAEVEESFLSRPLKARLHNAMCAGDLEAFERLTRVAIFLGRTTDEAK